MAKHSGNPKKTKKAIKKDLPFHVDDPGCTKPGRSMRDKQRASIIAGLRHLGAPVDPWLLNPGTLFDVCVCVLWGINAMVWFVPKCKPLMVRAYTNAEPLLGGRDSHHPVIQRAWSLMERPHRSF